MTSSAEEALDFMRAHPEVVQQFDEVAAELIRRGHKRYSADVIFHLLRWQTGRDLDNRFTATFARDWLRRHPRHPRFFELRRSLADGLVTTAQMSLI